MARGLGSHTIKRHHINKDCLISQGITLTDLQEAERTFSRSRAERFTQEQPSERSDRLRASEGSGGKQEDIARRESREVNSPWTRNLDEEASKAIHKTFPPPKLWHLMSNRFELRLNEKVCI